MQNLVLNAKIWISSFPLILDWYYQELIDVKFWKQYIKIIAFYEDFKQRF